MAKTTLTPGQLKQISRKETSAVCQRLGDFITENKVNKTHLANAVGMKQQNINKVLSGETNCRLDTLILIQLGLEALTGSKFQIPTFLTRRPTGNAKEVEL